LQRRTPPFETPQTVTHNWRKTPSIEGEDVRRSQSERMQDCAGVPLWGEQRCRTNGS
jgi:hypothetical protein